MRNDVLKAISSAKDVSNAIILTHNIDFVFVQTVALAAFRRCGHPTITIFADAACAAESFAHQAPVLAGLGIRYRVVPVAMDPGFRFHPKAVLLSGEAAATLLVGSGNLTFGGWRENAEVWLRFDSERDGVAPFQAFRNYLAEVLGRVALPDAVAAEVDAAFDPKSKSWVSTETVAAAGFVGRVGSGPTILDRMLDLVGSDPTDELLVCTPYFDAGGLALQQLATRVGAQQTTVLCQPERSTLTQQAWELNSGLASLQRVDFRRTCTSGEERSAFIHAKFYAFRRNHEVIVLAGSANCSRAALTISGRAGNAELLVGRVLTSNAFEEEFLGELTITTDPFVLRDEPLVDPVGRESIRTGLRVLAARFEAGSLLVAYSPPSVEILECLIDEKPVQFVSVEKGVLRASCVADPKSVTIRAWVDGEVVDSAPAWIDHERCLRATSRGRGLADSIRARIQPGEWNANGWAEVLGVFCKHLSYMPPSPTVHATSFGPNNREPTGVYEFTAADVFSLSYRVPSLNAIRIPDSLGRGSHVQSIQQLLIRWFSIVTEAPNIEGAADSDHVESEGDEVVDRPESLYMPKPSAAEVTERERRRIEKLLCQLEAVIMSTEFLAERSPGNLATDLKLASALLRLGLREGWVERKRFFELTQNIWCSLFFSSAPQGNVGWLEYRAQTSEDIDAFISEMQSTELSAALIGWKLAAPTDDGTPEAARFALAAVLAVARLPWLWHGGEPDEIANELAILLSYTADPGENREALVSQAESAWALLLQRGHAMRLLEAAVKSLSPAEIRDRISSDKLQPGDLLWQGNAGFFVVRHQASRAANGNVTVLRLQGDGGDAMFKASFTIPMLALLSEGVVPRSDDFGDEPRKILREFIDELNRAFSR